jgi:uncharacterized delta-60 repeat protein
VFLEYVAGAQTAELSLSTLSLGEVSHSADGGYWVVVSNEVGSVTSAVATLTVTEPGILIQPASQVAQPGDIATFTVTPAGTVPFQFQWWKDGVQLAGDTNSSLTLINLAGEDAGDYWVVVSNQYGSVTSAVAELAVNLATLDPGFNPGANSWVYSLAVQPDGKVLVGGTFTTLAGQPCNGIGRLNAEGTLDSSFHAGVSGQPGQPCWVNAIAVQADGKILVGGDFMTLDGQPCSSLGRVNSDGTLDNQFNPGLAMEDQSPSVLTLAVQADGKILVGGLFTELGGQPCQNLGRLNADGTLDLGFAPEPDGAVNCVLVQGDGSILVSGDFSVMAGQVCYCVGRLNADGTPDSGFNAGTMYGYVWSLALQADGKVVLGGWFTTGTLPWGPPTFLARLNADGSLDSQFNPQASLMVNSLAVQADGKILVGGQFTTLGGQARCNLGRLNADGTLDSQFDVPVGSAEDAGDDFNFVYPLVAQPDGTILLGGWVQTLGGVGRFCLERLTNTEPATQSLGYDGSTITWLRGGASPEVCRTDFAVSTNGADWTFLGEGGRVPGGWQLAASSLPPNSTLVARGWLGSGWHDGSGWFVQACYGLPLLLDQPASRTNDATTTATFSVAASGSEPLGFQWFKDGAPLVSGGNVSGAQTAKLVLTNVLHSDAGAYSVVVSNAFGSVTSALALLTVIEPDIALQPTGQSAQPGQKATFTVKAAGTAPFEFQWWKDGAALAGDTAASLTLTNLGAANAGDYWVVVSGPYGSVTSAVAELTVNLVTLDNGFQPARAELGSLLAVQPDGKVLVAGSGWLRRLNGNGTLDAAFSAQVGGASPAVSSVAVQADGRMVVGGSFTQLDGQPRNRIGRLNADGSLDAQFDPGPTNQSAEVNCLAAQADGEVVVGGSFTTLGGQPCTNLGRLNLDGTLDNQFTPAVSGSVSSLAVQPDGKVLVGGSLTWPDGGLPLSLSLCRLNPDGTLDGGFNASLGGSVNCLVVQADGKVLVGGHSLAFDEQSCTNLGRLNPDGTLDSQFNSAANQQVRSLALQADGKVLVGGWFTTLDGQPRNYLTRLNPDGTLDSEFNPGAGGMVSSLALQADGKVLVSGLFTALDGEADNLIGRLNNPEPATQSLSWDGSAITWLRGGSSPEVWYSTFEVSTDNINWTMLGSGSRIPGGWQLSGVPIPTGATIRARGFFSTGAGNSSSSLVETVLPPGGLAPPLLILNDGHFGFGASGFGFDVSGAAGQVVAVDGSSNLVNWLPLQTNTFGAGPWYFSDPGAKAKGRQFYRARLVQ